MEKELTDIFYLLALREVCSYIDIFGNPVLCSWEEYKKYHDNELTRYKLDEYQFNYLCNYIRENYKGEF